MAVFIQQTVVHAPGVHAERGQVPQSRPLESIKGLLRLVEQIEAVPVQDAAEVDVVVFKAVQLLHGDLLTVKGTENAASVAGAQIKGQHM